MWKGGCMVRHAPTCRPPSRGEVLTQAGVGRCWISVLPTLGGEGGPPIAAGLGRIGREVSPSALPFSLHKQGSFLTPLLKRTSSAKGTLKRAPSVVIIEKGKVLQKRKVR